MASEEVETVAEDIAKALGSTAFDSRYPRDTEEWQHIRDNYRDMAKTAIVLHRHEARLQS